MNAELNSHSRSTIVILDRSFSILRMLRERRMSVREIAQESGIAMRSVRRYLMSFECSGVPLIVQMGEDGWLRYSIDRKWSL